MPTSDALSREHLSAWQRWELASLDGHPARPGAAGIDREAVAAAERAAATAVAEGRAAGYAEGRAAAEQERARLAVLLRGLTQRLSDHEQRLADEVLDLALVFTQQLVGEALAVRRELLLPIIASALRQLPQATQRVDVVVNPGDLVLVQSAIAAEPLGDRCRVSANADVTPGGCRLETEQCDIDATVELRWKRLLGSLGRTEGWLEDV